MKLIDMGQNIYCIQFKTQHDLASTMLRFQEYYENPHFKGRIFSLEEFKKWYIKHSPRGKKYGKFFYYKDWAGFNIPSHTLKPFYEGLFDPLSAKEKKILKLFSKKKGKFYIIALFGPLKKLIQHEMAHGVYYTNQRYRKEVNEIIKSTNKKALSSLYKYFRKHQGYHKDVFVDEAHAYILSELPFLKRRGLNIEKFKSIRPQLEEAMKKYYNHLTV